MGMSIDRPCLCKWVVVHGLSSDGSRAALLKINSKINRSQTYLPASHTAMQEAKNSKTSKKSKISKISNISKNSKISKIFKVSKIPRPSGQDCSKT